MNLQRMKNPFLTVFDGGICPYFVHETLQKRKIGLIIRCKFINLFLRCRFQRENNTNRKNERLDQFILARGNLFVSGQDITRRSWTKSTSSLKKKRAAS